MRLSFSPIIRDAFCLLAPVGLQPKRAPAAKATLAFSFLGHSLETMFAALHSGHLAISVSAQEAMLCLACLLLSVC